jgi:hypothetical protein
MKIFKLFSSDLPYKYKIEKGIGLLGLDLDVPLQDKEFILNEVTQYVFKMQTQQGEKILDLEHDFKYYYTDFLKLGIDLNKQDISWWEFDNILEGILLQGNSTLGKVLEYRTYEKPTGNYKTHEQREHKFNMEKKRQYSLPKPKSVENGLEKLWKYTEGKVNINE